MRSFTSDVEATLTRLGAENGEIKSHVIDQLPALRAIVIFSCFVAQILYKNRFSTEIIFLGGIFIFLLLPLSLKAALSAKALNVEAISDSDDGQGVTVTVDDSPSIRTLEFHFVGRLKPVDEKGEVFLTNASHSIIGFNARPATENQHIYLVCECSGTVASFSDCGAILTALLKSKMDHLDPSAFILTSIRGNIAKIRYETHMRTGGFDVDLSLAKGALEIVKIGPVDK